MKAINQNDLSGKRVLMRVDYNVPLGPDGRVADDTRIKQTLPTLKKLLAWNCRTILIAHLGRPEGKVNSKFTLKPAAERLAKLTGKPVQFIDSCAGEAVKTRVMAMKPGEIVMLENLRFNPGEESNDPAFAGELASLAEVFVQEAFGTVHRAHASTDGVPKLLPHYAGDLVAREVDKLGLLMAKPPQPFIAVMGGKKVKDKIGVIKNLAVKCDAILIGGAMAYTFLKAKGASVGSSLVDEKNLAFAGEMLKKYPSKIMLPQDHVVKEASSEKTREEGGENIPDGWAGYDIGPKTRAAYKQKIASAKAIFFNGAMGVFEQKPFENGTRDVLEAMAQATKSGAVSVLGGGETAQSAEHFGKAAAYSHISTGGGAALEFMEGGELPGLAALK